MMDKYALYPGVLEGGSPAIHLIEPGTRYGLDSTGWLDKTASGEHIDDVNLLVESIQPQPDRLYLLNSALASGEVVGFNLRGDWFNESGLTHTPKGWSDIPVWDIDTRRRVANSTEKVAGWGDLAWGFPTFYNAHRFRHHANKDPNRAYGYVLGSFWDERMRRVILVTELIRELCEAMGAVDLYDRIAAGECPDTSMGSRNPYDECSICGNIARSPEQYCEHVRKDARPPYGMRSILDDGRMCGVYNPYPRFFDDSFVFVGAERSAKTMANLTDSIRGTREYNQRVYPFIPPISKMASGDEYADPTRTNAEERAEHTENLAASAKDIFAVPEPDDTLEQKLSRLLSGQSLSAPREREATRFLRDYEKATGRVKAGTLSAKEFDLWMSMEKKKLSELGIGEADLRAVKERTAAQGMASLNKTSSMKWADIIKTIHLPAESHLATIRSHEGGMPDLPREALDYIAESPGTRIRAAAQLGVVLRPHEFQYAMLKGSHPEEAQEFLDNGIVFPPKAPVEIKDEYDPSAPVPREHVQKAAEFFGPWLEKRSFAPKAVRARMGKKGTEKCGSAAKVGTHPLLDEVSDAYNEYRAGLVARAPDWRYVPVRHSAGSDLGEEEKLADAAIRLSTDLLRLAYWPALPVG